MSHPGFAARVPPVYSPLSGRALVSAIAGALSDAPEQRLKRTLEERYGVAEAVLVDSGTTALALALRAAPGRVALPAFGCFDLATACDAAGVQPVLYDIDPATLGPDPESLARAIVSRVSAVVVVHMYGIPAPLDEIADRAAQVGATVVEDAAQASGVLIAGGRAGGLGRFGVLSFGRGKGVTGGGGGALLLRDEDAIVAYRRVAVPLRAPARLPGWALTATIAQLVLSRPSLYGIPASLPGLRLGDTVYREPHEPGRISPFSAALALKSLEAEDAEAAVRRRNAEHLIARTEGAEAIWIPRPCASGATAGYLRLPVLARSPEAQARLRSGRGRALGLVPSYPVSLADLRGFAERAELVSDPTGARRLAADLITAPVHSQLSSLSRDRLEGLLLGGP